MDLKPYAYATSFYNEVIRYFNARLTMIECEYIIAFELEYLDSVDSPSIGFENQETQVLLQKVSPERKDRPVFEGIETRNLLILRFPYMWGVKPKNPLLWDAESGINDARFILKKTGRIENQTLK